MLLKDLYMDVNLSEVDVNDYFAWTTASRFHTVTSENGEISVYNSVIVPENLLYDQGWMFFMVSYEDFNLECSYPGYKEHSLYIHRDGNHSTLSRPINGSTESIGFSAFHTLYPLITVYVSAGDGLEDRAQTITTDLLAENVRLRQCRRSCDLH